MSWAGREGEGGGGAVNGYKSNLRPSAEEHCTV